MQRTLDVPHVTNPLTPPDGLPVTLAIVCFAALSIAAAITSEGFLEADACTHYLYARFAFQQPHYFINIWGRPMGLAIGCALVAYRIAKNQKYRWPALALIFTLAQPLVFLHSFSELTELPVAFLLGLAFWAYQKRQWFWTAVLVGLLPLSRPEGFGLLILGALALLVHRRWWCASPRCRSRVGPAGAVCAAVEPSTPIIWRARP